MEIKTIGQIKEEVSREFLHPYRTWLENSRFSNDDNISVLEDSGAIDEAMTRYASQFQTNTDIITTEICVLRERVAELEDMLQSVVDLQSDNYGNGMKTHLALIIKAKEIESLINKGKDNGI